MLFERFVDKGNTFIIIEHNQDVMKNADYIIDIGPDECNIDWSQYLKLQNELRAIIRVEEDSLRFYNLGNNYTQKIIHIGINPSINFEGDLII